MASGLDGSCGQGQDQADNPNRGQAGHRLRVVQRCAHPRVTQEPTQGSFLCYFFFMHPLLQKLKDHFVPSKYNTYRPHLLRRGFLIFFLMVSLAAEAFLVANLVVRQSGINFLAAVVQSEIITLTNTVRAESKVGSVIENTQLNAAAQAKANDMATQGYFAHVGPDGREPWAWVTEAGYNYQWAGENLAVHFVDSRDIIHAWMASPSHRANLVKLVYTDIGVGIANGIYQGQPVTFVVQYFGKQEPLAFASVQEGKVKGAEVGYASVGNSNTHSFGQEEKKQFARFGSEPRATTQWVLGVV